MDLTSPRARFGAWDEQVVGDPLQIGRRLRVLERGTAPVIRHSGLTVGRTCQVIPGEDLKRLVLAIAGKPDGLLSPERFCSDVYFADHGPASTGRATGIAWSLSPPCRFGAG